MPDSRIPNAPETTRETLAALSSLGSSRNAAMALRARRAVREAVIVMDEEKGRSRRNLGIALLAFASLFVLLSPILWSSMDELMAGEHIFDASAMITMLAVAVATAVCAALIAGWRRQGKRTL